MNKKLYHLIPLLILIIIFLSLYFTEGKTYTKRYESARGTELEFILTLESTFWKDGLNPVETTLRIDSVPGIDIYNVYIVLLLEDWNTIIITHGDFSIIHQSIKTTQVEYHTEWKKTILTAQVVATEDSHDSLPRTLLTGKLEVGAIKPDTFFNRYGLFVILSSLELSLQLFLVLKYKNRFRKKYPSTEKTTVPSEVLEILKSSYCTNCGSKLEDDFVYCQECGKEREK